MKRRKPHPGRRRAAREGYRQALQRAVPVHGELLPKHHGGVPVARDRRGPFPCVLRGVAAEGAGAPEERWRFSSRDASRRKACRARRGMYSPNRTRREWILSSRSATTPPAKCAPSGPGNQRRPTGASSSHECLRSRSNGDPRPHARRPLPVESPPAQQSLGRRWLAPQSQHLRYRGELPKQEDCAC